VGGACPALLADWNNIIAVELYNHSDSPVPHDYGVETVNIAGLESSKEVEQELHQMLYEFNTRGAAKP
jgi:hypothetical protein